MRQTAPNDVPGTLSDIRPYSYRDDPAVPVFDDSAPVAFMDGDCVLCTTGARVIARLDHRLGIRICPVQSALGQAMLAHLGQDPDDTETWIYLRDGQAHAALDAMICMGRDIGGPGWLLQPLRLLPRGGRDWLYRRIALNRYHLFGRTDMCAVPDPKLRRRLIE
ncbi:MAG: DCC1-like thiol-disulfide oxidoreductase family protein [Minwuia sp.]|nr:DCC1-like thiol-disulfide oxidoreductase family protein [Minwuia sp.]